MGNAKNAETSSQVVIFFYFHYFSGEDHRRNFILVKIIGAIILVNRRNDHRHIFRDAIYCLAQTSQPICAAQKGSEREREEREKYHEAFVAKKVSKKVDFIREK